MFLLCLLFCHYLSEVLTIFYSLLFLCFCYVCYFVMISVMFMLCRILGWCKHYPTIIIVIIIIIIININIIITKILRILVLATFVSPQTILRQWEPRTFATGSRNLSFPGWVCFFTFSSCTFYTFFLFCGDMSSFVAMLSLSAISKLKIFQHKCETVKVV